MRQAKKWIFKIIVSLSTAHLPLHASSLTEAIPQSTAAQKEFAQLVDAKQYTEAMMAWGPAFSGSKYSKSNTGVAVQAFLMAQSGLPVMASHWIISDTNLDKISDKIKSPIVELIKTNAKFLSASDAHKSWRKVLEELSPIKISSRKELLKATRRLAKTSKKDIKQRAEIYWALSVGASKLNDTRLAEIYIRDLKGLDQDFISKDKVNMQLARVLFQKNKLSEAIDLYSLIPKSSDLWLDAIEERAWAYLRLSNFDKARGDITTLLAPTFKDYTTPEVFVLSAITNLKICDYHRILKDNRMFKTD
ncbi:hypothetical protein GW916_00985, partial [bacterium]|nr:hypothetical protein [bacterium]